MYADPKCDRLSIHSQKYPAAKGIAANNPMDILIVLRAVRSDIVNSIIRVSLQLPFAT